MRTSNNWNHCDLDHLAMGYSQLENIVLKLDIPRIITELKKFEQLKGLNVWYIPSEGRKYLKEFSINRRKVWKIERIFNLKITFTMNEILFNDFPIYLPKLQSLLINGLIRATELTTNILSRIAKTAIIDRRQYLLFPLL